MPRPRGLLPITPGDGEIGCPRKGSPFPAVISVMSCHMLHEQAPLLCGEHKCTNHKKASIELEEIARMNNLDKLTLGRRSFPRQVTVKGSEQQREGSTDADAI